MPGTVKSEGFWLEVRKFNFIVQISALLCFLLKKPQIFRCLTQKWKIQVDERNSYFHGSLQFNSKRTIEISGNSHTVTLKEV